MRISTVFSLLFVVITLASLAAVEMITPAVWSSNKALVMPLMPPRIDLIEEVYCAKISGEKKQKFCSIVRKLNELKIQIDSDTEYRSELERVLIKVKLSIEKVKGGADAIEIRKKSDLIENEISKLERHLTYWNTHLTELIKQYHRAKKELERWLAGERYASTTPRNTGSSLFSSLPPPSLPPKAGRRESFNYLFTLLPMECTMDFF